MELREIPPRRARASVMEYRSRSMMTSTSGFSGERGRAALSQLRTRACAPRLCYDYERGGMEIASRKSFETRHVRMLQVRCPKLGCNGMQRFATECTRMHQRAR